MSWLSDTIAGRTIAVLVVGLGSIIVMAQVLYQSGLEREIAASNREAVVDRLVSIAHTIETVAVDKRDETAHRMSGGPLELHWGNAPLAKAGGTLDPLEIYLRDLLVSRAPQFGKLGLVIGTSRPDGGTSPSASQGHHTTLISIPLADASWLNVTLARVVSARANSPSFVLSIALAALGVVFVALLMGRWLTGPLDHLATGARGLFVTAENVPLPEGGTREVRTLARAINELQGRIRKLIDDRTEMLAAVSHDLRTPLTRLKLRIEAIRESELRNSIAADLAEMEEMIDATLTFLRDDMAKESVEPVDISAILETITTDSEDAGHTVTLDITRAIVVPGRHLALKRALTNLIQNAIKHGKCAAISAYVDGSVARIVIRDRGAGIPADEFDKVFEPFYRLDKSRGRRGGGYGLGLSVARSILRGHGGDVVLANQVDGGLEAIVSLPVLKIPVS